METSLHHALKNVYADGNPQTEVKIGRYRIDVVAFGELVEIQVSRLSAIRKKVLTLLREHRVRVVKPLVREKLLVKQETPEGPVLSRRRSPKRGSLLDLFDELSAFRGIFPHPQLAVEVVLVDVEEWRLPRPAPKRRYRQRNYSVFDLRLREICEIRCLRTASDLLQLIPLGLAEPFDTGMLAGAMGIPRWQAQRVVYCLRHCGALEQVGKCGNSKLYAYQNEALAGCAPGSTGADGFRLSA